MAGAAYTLNGSNNGRLMLSYGEAAGALGMGKASVQRAFDQLIDHGFLVLEKKGTWYSRRAHEWRLTTKSVDRAGGRDAATHDWRDWRPPKTERGSKSEPSSSSVVPYKNPKAVLGSKPEPVSPFLSTAVGSKTEH